MIIYLIVFFISIYTTWLAEKSTKQKPIFFFLSCIAILIPTILAGCRDSGIGTDTLIYVDEYWNRIVSTRNWDDLISSYNQEVFDSIEPVYLLINWIASLFGNEVQWAYFMTNLCVILPIYCAAYDNRKKAPMWLSMTMFFLLCYNPSLNLVRQSIALALCIYSYKYLEQKKWIKSIFWFFVIINTHNTGIFYICFIILFYVCSIPKETIRKIMIFCYITTLPLAFILFNYIILLVITIGILPSKYLMYIVDENYGLIPKANLIIYIIMLFLMKGIGKITLHNKNTYLSSRILSYYFYNQLIGTILFCTSFISIWASRISLYFIYPTVCIFLARVIYSIKHKSLYKPIIVIFISILLFLWFWTVVLNNDGETYPYKSKILGF